jgi:hypothetical protein
MNVQIVEGKYVVYEQIVDDHGHTVLREVEDALVLTPSSAYATVALMALARCWEQHDQEVARGLRQTIADWSPSPEADVDRAMGH